MQNFTIEGIILLGDADPERVVVSTTKSKRLRKWSGVIELKDKEGDNLTRLTKTIYKFKTQAEALKYMNEMVEWCRNYVKSNEVLDA